MIQNTEITVKVRVSYDDELLSEHAAQQIWLQGTPAEVRANAWGYRGFVSVASAEIIDGQVNRDGVPIKLPQPRSPR